MRSKDNVLFTDRPLLANFVEAPIVTIRRQNVSVDALLYTDVKKTLMHEKEAILNGIKELEQNPILSWLAFVSPVLFIVAAGVGIICGGAIVRGAVGLTAAEVAVGACGGSARAVAGTAAGAWRRRRRSN